MELEQIEFRSLPPLCTATLSWVASSHCLRLAKFGGTSIASFVFLTREAYRFWHQG